ncbi:putative acyl-CoA dehydrogenase [Sphingobium herbicidovorans NBRC 16415]|uniref:Acyl-CoA dehydrogenase n=1 Tax=Sphingobium herbicidovorans (strain ATCC 700291 / DSM 11019 / CCUG 56400 / KCTC 2939 / LMG 18315 / NBRC 16415 / MH) TaxID=1219045 RepID=A0A086PC26_SPHHM|nr:acyl-CoA dehydrogenase family protein [Sphingobium herbicidovorans]KFG90944.1 putative acyl-CoA dehydrogenase [Sphingobium herbicidovorans NBRC 16415]
MDFELNETQLAVVDGINKICADFPDSYWLEKDNKHEFPHDFAQAVCDGGYFGIMMPEEYGGAGLGYTEAALMMQAIAESGACMAGCTSIHVNIFMPGAIRKHASPEQKERWISRLMTLQDRAAFCVTEPGAGIDTTHITTRAEWNAERQRYLISGQKVWISVAQQANKIMVLARTTPLEKTSRPADGLSLFYTDLDRDYVDVQLIDKMGRHAVDSNAVFFDGLPVRKEDLIGEEGRGLEYLFSSLNAERILAAAECVGMGRAALRRASDYARERVVFDRPIGKNQAIQHPLAANWCQLEAANLMMLKAAWLYDNGKSCGVEANAAKWLAAEAGFDACQQAIMTHGGMGYAKEYHVERYLRELQILRIGPIPPPLMLSFIAERQLGMPKSY